MSSSKKSLAAKPPAAKKAKPEPVADSGTESDDTDDDELGMFEGDDDEDGEDSEDEEDGDNTVDVEFNFLDPREIHFKSVRRLLEHFLPGEEEHFNVSGLADAIVAQVAVGSMVTVNDDALDVYAFATVLPVALYKVRARRAARRPRPRAARRCVLSLAIQAPGKRFFSGAHSMRSARRGVPLRLRLLESRVSRRTWQPSRLGTFAATWPSARTTHTQPPALP